MSPHEHSPSTLTTRIAEADPADLDAATLHTAGALARAAGSGAAPARTGLRRPALIASLAGGLALTGGIAAATTGVLDLFGPDAPIVTTVPVTDSFPGPVEGEVCSIAFNVIPNDGTEHTDASGATFGASGSAETFDADDYAATVAFLEDHDWSDALANLTTTLPEGTVATTTVTDDEARATTYLPPDGALAMAVIEALQAEGLNLTGSASYVSQTDCGASDDE